MTLTRRRFVSRAAALAAGGLLPARTLAEMTLGGARLTTVSDGTLTLPGSFIFAPMPQDALSPILAEYGLSQETLTPECNLALFRDGTHTVLFDAGSGPNFMPSAGKVTASLAAIGLTPKDVTHVVFTHAHPDHIWGVLDDFDEPLFTDAVHMMGRSEWDYWWDPETVDRIGEARAAFAVGARNRMQAIEDRVVLFDEDDEILPGVLAVASFGHTPGHMSFELRHGSAGAMVVGDAIGNHHVAFRQPGWVSGSDQDAEMAAATRRALFDRIIADDLPIAGFHLPDGGMGRVERDGDAYRFSPEAG